MRSGYLALALLLGACLETAGQSAAGSDGSSPAGEPAPQGSSGADGDAATTMMMLPGAGAVDGDQGSSGTGTADKAASGSVGGTGGTDAPPGATTGAGSAKVMQFLELAAAATSMRCACWGCDAVSPEDAAAVALCEARWHDANPGPASECMLDMTIARIECALAAGCDPDALLACDNSEQQEVTCPPAPNEDVLLACYDGILDAGPAPSSGGSAGAGAGPGPVVVVVDPCESDVQLFIACEAFCTAKTDAAQCAGGTYDKDLCLDSCLRTGELAVLESTCSERWDCIQCQLPYLQCDATYTCSGSMGPSCTPTPCNVECMLEL